ncbi:3905_t:CDS:10, partial [Acaulospora morrowiae]
NPANLNFEHLLLYVTQKHAESRIKSLKEKLCSTEVFEKDVEIIEGHQEFPEDFISDDSPISDKVAKKYLKVIKLRVWLSESRYVKVGVDIRSSRIVIEENNKNIEEDFIKICEEKLVITPDFLSIVPEVFLYIKFSSMLTHIENAAKYLKFDVHRGVILSIEDNARLGTKQLLFLRFPQYTDYFLIFGMLERESRYWLAVLSRVATTRYIYDKSVRDPTHRITSIQRIPLEDLVLSDHEGLDSIVDIIDKGKSILQEGEILEQKGTEVVPGKRNFEEIDNRMEESDSPRKRKLKQAEAEFEYEIILLSKISSLCRARISYRKMEELLKSHDLSFNTVQPDSSTEFLDSNASISLNSAIPILKLDRRQLLIRLPVEIEGAMNVFGDIYVRYVGSRLMDSSTSSAIMITSLKPDNLPTISDVISMDHIQYDLSSQILSFKYNVTDPYIDKFLGDWNNIVMICQTATQVLNFVWNDLHYTEDLFVEIEWNVNKYVLRFGVNNSENRRNPHQRICNYLQNALNIERKVDSLIPALIKTAPLFSVLDELYENNNVLSGGKFLSIIPRSFNHIRLIYSSR